MRVFFLLLLFAIPAFKAYAQSDVIFIKGGYINQGGPKGFQLGVNISEDYVYFTKGFSIATSGLWQDERFYISPRAGYELQVSFIAVAAEISYLRDNFYFIPQIGLTVFSNFDLLFGYNAKFAGGNQTKVDGLFFSTTINLNLSKRKPLRKIGG